MHRSQQDGEAFLRKMIVMRENIADAFGSHRHHRNAVGQAIALVGTSLKEGEAVKESLMRLRGEHGCRDC